MYKLAVEGGRQPLPTLKLPASVTTRVEPQAEVMPVRRKGDPVKHTSTPALLSNVKGKEVFGGGAS